MEANNSTVCLGKNGEVYQLETMFKTVRELLGENQKDEHELKIFMRSEMFKEIFPDWYEAFNLMEARVLEQMKEKTLKYLFAELKQEKNQSDGDSGHDHDHDHQEKRESEKEIKIEKKSHQQQDHQVAHSSNKQPPPPQLNPEPKGKNYINSSDIKQEKNDSDSDSGHHQEKRDKKKMKEESGHRKDKKKSHHHHHRHHHDNQGAHSSKQPPPPPQQQQQQPQQNREPKGKSYYNPSSAKAIQSGKVWKPHEDVEFSKNEKPFKLGGLSILCVDLANLNKIFYDPSKGHHSAKSTAAITLKRNMIIPDRKADEIVRHETKKRQSFEPRLRKMYIKNVKKNRQSKNYNNNKESGGKGGATTKDQRQKGLEQLREKKAEEKNKTTRKLAWEDKEFFDNKKKQLNNRPQTAEKNKDGKEKSTKPVLGKIPKIHAPGTSMQAILQQISSANVEAAKKPKIELKIPKVSETPYTYNKKQPIQKSVTQGLVAIEVDKLLRSNTLVKCPAMSTDLAEYTIRKIGWWLLKEEQDPPDEGLYHPELHDNEMYDEWYDPDDHIDDDNISMGCVSDPEGLEEPVVPAGKKPEKPDADKLDEYAGLATLESRIPKVSADMKPGKTVEWVRFIKTKQGTAYEKNNFEAKCYMCDGEIVKGRRQLGAHFRSDHHKDAFRNYSLKLATYGEQTVKVPAKKLFVAKLVQYSTEDYLQGAPTTIDISNSPLPLSKSVSPLEEIGNDILVPDSPRAVIDSNRESPPPQTNAEMIRLQDLDEELSLPSLAMYDIEQDNVQLRAKICLRTNGLWTDEMEKRWLLMQEKETRLTSEYNELREKYINSPDAHPLKDKEWIKFWERRCNEVEAEGKNPDEMDFSGEWIPFWLKRVQEIMKADTEMKMLNMKQELGLDATTLTDRCRRHGLSPDSVQIGACNQQSSTSGGDIINVNQPQQPSQSNSFQPAIHGQELDKQNIQQKGGDLRQVLDARNKNSARLPPSTDGQQMNNNNKQQQKDGDLRHVLDAARNNSSFGVQQMNQLPSSFSNHNAARPPPPPPPHLGSTKPEHVDSHYNKNAKDQNSKSERNRRRRERKREAARARSPPVGGDRNRYNNNNTSNHHRNDRKREYRQSPPPRHFDNCGSRRPSTEHFNKQKVSSPESDWETAEPQQKLAKPSAFPNTNQYSANQYVPPKRSSTEHFNKQKVSSPESDWETAEPQQKLAKPSAFPNTNQYSANQYVPPKRPSTEHFKQKVSSPESDWEKAEPQQKLAKPSAFPNTSTNQYSGNQYVPPKHTENRPTSSFGNTQGSSDNNNKIADPKESEVLPPVSSMKEVYSTAVVAPTLEETSQKSNNISSLLAELDEAIKFATPIISPKISADAANPVVVAGGLSTLEPILSDYDDAADADKNEVPYSPVSVLSLVDNNDDDPFRGISPINSIEMSVEMMPVEEVVDNSVTTTPTLEKPPKRSKKESNNVLNPSSPEDGEIVEI